MALIRIIFHVGRILPRERLKLREEQQVHKTKKESKSREYGGDMEQGTRTVCAVSQIECGYMGF